VSQPDPMDSVYTWYRDQEAKRKERVRLWRLKRQLTRGPALDAADLWTLLHVEALQNFLRWLHR
jgi:hypothetical protein